MAGTLNINASIEYADDAGSRCVAQVADLAAAVATEGFSQYTLSAGTSDTELALGGLAAHGWCLVKNLDATNYVELKTSSAGVYFAKLLPGEFIQLRFGSGVTDPYAKAHTAACVLEVTVFPT